MTIRFLFIGLILLPMLASCVKQGDVDSLNARMARNEQQMQQLSSQVGNVEQVLPGQAEMWAQMQAVRQELNAARGQLDELTAGGAGGSQNARLAASVNRLEAAVRQMAAELGLKVEALD
ncbi:MAG: tol-pal system protein YbgF, partial [Deltaproteobacteria bacterium]|nr:tol-pal system protein YbgF [Deltaproteobacteria bacterium]